MSKFLGPVHFWLHSKITLQEAIEVACEARLTNLGYNLDSLQKWDDLYSKPNPNESLESVIDEGNIHGWLQKRIGFAETRFAGKITDLKAAHGDEILKELHPIFESYATLSAQQLVDSGTWDTSLQSAHKLLHNQILEGMPCDHGGAVTLNDENLFQWKNDKCLHQGFWVAVNGNVEDHHQFRDTFNNAFFKTLGAINYARTVQNGSTYYQINR